MTREDVELRPGRRAPGKGTLQPFCNPTGCNSLVLPGPEPRETPIFTDSQTLVGTRRHEHFRV